MSIFGPLVLTESVRSQSKNNKAYKTDTHNTQNHKPSGEKKKPANIQQI